MRFVETKNAVKNVVFGETFEVSENVTEKVNAVIAALTDSRYNMRTIAGIVKDNGAVVAALTDSNIGVVAGVAESNLTEDEAVMVLLALFECKLITVYMREDGKVFYRFMQHLAATETAIN